MAGLRDALTLESKVETTDKFTGLLDENYMSSPWQPDTGLRIYTSA